MIPRVSVLIALCLMLAGSGFAASPAADAVGRPVTAGELPEWRRSERVIVRGAISAVGPAGGEMAGTGSARAPIGRLWVVADDGQRYVFGIDTCTLILIQDRDGRLWIGRLEQLRPGWRCTVAYGIPDEDDENPDFRGRRAEIEVTADNLVAEVPPRDDEATRDAVDDARSSGGGGD